MDNNITMVEWNNVIQSEIRGQVSYKSFRKCLGAPVFQGIHNPDAVHRNPPLYHSP